MAVVVVWRYSLRSLLVRRTSAALTVLGIALTTATFVGVMALAKGLETAFLSTGEPLNVLILRRGSESELQQFHRARRVARRSIPAERSEECSRRTTGFGRARGHHQHVPPR